MLLILWSLFEAKSIDFFVTFFLLVLCLVVIISRGMVKERFSVLAVPTIAIHCGSALFSSIHGSKIKEIKFIILLASIILNPADQILLTKCTIQR